MVSSSGRTDVEGVSSAGGETCARDVPCGRRFFLNAVGTADSISLQWETKR